MWIYTGGARPKIGIIQALISDYERDKLRLHAEMVLRFALALDVTTDETPWQGGRAYKAAIDRQPSISTALAADRQTLEERSGGATADDRRLSEPEPLFKVRRESSKQAVDQKKVGQGLQKASTDGTHTQDTLVSLEAPQNQFLALVFSGTRRRIAVAGLRARALAAATTAASSAPALGASALFKDPRPPGR